MTRAPAVPERRRRRLTRRVAVLLALPLLGGCASLGVGAPGTAWLDPADSVRLDRADVACYHGVTFR